MCDADSSKVSILGSVAMNQCPVQNLNSIMNVRDVEIRLAHHTMVRGKRVIIVRGVQECRRMQ
jgi:hypothetical protein